MKKTDALISAVIGLFIGVFFFIILKNINSEFFWAWILIIVFPPLSLLGMLVASFLGKKFLIIYQAGKFVLVGALNTFIDLGILNILIWVSGFAAGAWYSAFKAISFLVATTNSYFWNKHWTFEKSRRAFVPGEFSKFVTVTVVGFLLNVGVASIVVNVIGPQWEISAKLWATIGAVTATLVAFTWNFLASKFIVFKN